MGFGAPKAPVTPVMPLPPAASHPAVLGSSLTALNNTSLAKRAAAASTVGTSPQGLKTPPPVAKASLLGQ